MAGPVYTDQGSGPLVVCFHGFPDTPASWDGIASALVGAGYRVVVPWLRGYHPDTIVDGLGYGAAEISADPLRLLDHLGEDQAVLVGHDWGASMVYGAANLAPDRVRAIVPIDIPHPSLIKPDPRVAWAVRHFAALKMPWAERSVARNDFAYIDELYALVVAGVVGVGALDESVARVKECFGDPRCLTGAISYYRALSPRAPKALERVPKVRGLVVGGGSSITDGGLFAKTAEAMADGSESEVFDGAGHWPHREQEERFTAALIGFLGRLDERPAPGGG